MPITLNDEKETGNIIASFSSIVPEGRLLCDGSAISRSVYSNLFGFAPSRTSTVTITIASPGVVTWNSHGLATGQSIQFTTTGGLPTGLAVGTVYFIRVIDTNTFHLYDTQANALNIPATTGRVNTSGSQSGTHTGLSYLWGNGNGSTTFNIPDFRGGVPRGAGTSTGYIQNITAILGAKDDDAGQSHTHTVTDAFAFASEPTSSGGSFLSAVSNTSTTRTTSDASFRVSTETKMKNVGVNFFIKY